MKNKLVNSIAAGIITFGLGLFAYLGQRNPKGELPLMIMFVGMTMFAVSGLASIYYDKGIKDASKVVEEELRGWQEGKRDG